MSDPTSHDVAINDHVPAAVNGVRRLEMDHPSPNSNSTTDSDDDVDLHSLSTQAPRKASHPSKMSAQQFNALAVPYGPDAPQSYLGGGEDEEVFTREDFDYQSAPSMAASWGKLARRLRSQIFVPFFPWWGNRQGYLRNGLFNDALAGLTCAVLVVPESLSVILLASLAPVVGLYTAAVAPFGYALLGTSPHVSVGPISLIVIFLPSIFREMGMDVEDHSAAALAERQGVGSLVSFYTFIIFGVMSLFKLGGMIKMLSHDLMTGYLSAVGVYVVLKEMKHLLDIHPPKGPEHEYNYQRLYGILSRIGEADVTSTIMGIIALIIFMTVKVTKRRYPATPERLQSRLFTVWYYVSSFTALIVVVVTTCIAYVLTKQGFRIRILGDVPSGLSMPTLPPLEKYSPGTMLLHSLPVALLGFVEAYSITKRYSVKYRYKIDISADLSAYSLSSLLCAVFGGVTPSGAFSRTSMSAEIGSKTPWANLFTGMFAIIATYNTQMLRYIPMCVLGALIQSVMINLISFGEIYHAFRIAKTSGLIMLSVFFVTLIMSIKDGLIFGVLASIGLLLYQLSEVDCVLMGREPHPLDGEVVDCKSTTTTQAHRTPLHLLSLRDNPRAVPVDENKGIIVIKPVASLFFGNAELLQDTIESILDRVEAARNGKGNDLVVAVASSSSKPTTTTSAAAGPWVLTEHLGKGIAHTRFILIDAGGSRLLDLWALSCLRRAVEDAAEKGIQVVISNGGKQLKKHLRRCGLYKRVGGPLVMHSTEEVFRVLSQAPFDFTPRSAAADEGSEDDIKMLPIDIVVDEEYKEERLE